MKPKKPRRTSNYTPMTRAERVAGFGPNRILADGRRFYLDGFGVAVPYPDGSEEEESSLQPAGNALREPATVKARTVRSESEGRESSEEVMAKTSAKRVAVKARKTTARERVAPARGKATESARKPAGKTAAAPKARGNKWMAAIFDIVGTKRGARFSQADLNKHEAKLAKANPDNNNVRATLRQTLQAMVKAGKITRVEKDGEMVPGEYKVA